MRLSVEVSGSGRDLVLLHGWGMNAAVWEGLPTAISERHRLCCIELPGHGASPFDPGWEDSVAWARACLDVAPPRAVWIAWSLGGLVALHAALEAPERIAALILITASPRFIQAPDWPAAMPAETLAQFHDGLLADAGGALHRFLALQVHGSDGARETLRLLRVELAGRPTPDAAALARGLELLREGDLRARLAEISCPSLWLFGERDTLVPAAVAGGVAEILPLARLTAIPRAAHAPFLSHPQETATAILDFLAEVD